MTSLSAPSLFIPHGGGPLPLYDVPFQRDLGLFMRTVARRVLVEEASPKAIVVVTAHWQSANGVGISSAPSHDLLYDYTFPDYPDAYRLKYPAPGDPKLARRIHEAFKESGIHSYLDDKRGWDHGTFIPMMLINPEADIPIVQVSCLANQDAEQHWDIGSVLGTFRDEGVAILGSGMSYHNMRTYRSPHKAGEVINDPFEEFLTKAAFADREARRSMLVSWRQQVGAGEAHPPDEADHFMPFIVAAAAAGTSECEKILDLAFKEFIRLGSYLWK